VTDGGVAAVQDLHDLIMQLHFFTIAT